MDIDIPGYRIEHELGRGGLATVYQAMQISLDRQVALKVMAPALAAEQLFGERFLREGQTVAQLVHPNIITIYDIGVSGYLHYIAMELLNAGSLKQYMGEPHDLEHSLSIVRQIAAALGYAHQKGFVHRDVKPENIMFRTDGTPVLTDFGIAKSATSDTRLTNTGAIVGTPRYMSPEQANGNEASPQSDIYALGIILYELLSGEAPYDLPDSIAILYAHVNKPIPVLPGRVSDIQPLIDSMLAKDPANRVPDCETLVDIIDLVQLQHRSESSSKAISKQIENKVRSGSSKLKRVDSSKFASPTGEVGSKHQRPPMKIHSRLSAVVIAVLVLTLSYWLLFVPTEPVRRSISNAELDVVSRSDLTIGSDDEALAVQTPVKINVESRPTLSRPAPTEDKAKPSPALIEKKPTKPPPPQGSAKASHKETLSGEIEKLLVTATAYKQSNRRLYPVGNSALDTYLKILKLNPEHRVAQIELQLIANDLADLVSSRMTAGRFEAAQLYVKRGLQAKPRDPRLSRYRQEINDKQLANVTFKQAEDFFYGRNGVGQNSEQACDKYLFAAENHHLLAKKYAATCLVDEVGVVKDERLALDYLRQVARGGDAEAQYFLSLGLLFSEYANPREAAYWVRQSVELRFARAYQVLSWMYESGVGLKQSSRSAIALGFLTLRGVITDDLQVHERRIRLWEQLFDIAYRESQPINEASREIRR